MEGEIRHLGETGEQALPDSGRKHAPESALASFSSEGTIVPSSPLYFPPSQRLRKENSGTGSRFILGYFEGRKVAERQSLPLSGSHSALPHCVLRLPRKPHKRSVICIFYFVTPPHQQTLGFQTSGSAGRAQDGGQRGEVSDVLPHS